MVKNQSLSKALSFAGCRDLPKALNPELDMFWIRAITLVKKKNGNEEFIVSEQRATGLVNHIADFGTMSPIGSVVRFYPYMYLDEGIRKSCATVSANMLAMQYPDKAAEIFSSGGEHLDSLRLQYAIDCQKNNVNGYVEYGDKDAVSAAEEEQVENVLEEAPKNDEMVFYEEGSMVIDEVVDLKPARKRTPRKRNK